MRFHHPMNDILGNEVRLAVLRVLTKSAPKGWTGRALAREVGFSPTQTGRALDALEGVGVIRRESAGRAFVWRLATDHVLAGSLVRLFSEEDGVLLALKSDLRAALAKLPAQKAWLFGSIAKANERTTSDIDLLVQVRSASAQEQVEESLSALTTQFIVRFGNPLSTIVVRSAQEGRGVDPELLREVRTRGVPLVGSP